MNDCEGCPLQGKCDLGSLRNHIVRDQGVSHLPDGFAFNSKSHEITNVSGNGPAKLTIGDNRIISCFGHDGLPLNQSLIHPVKQMDFSPYQKLPPEIAFEFYGRSVGFHSGPPSSFLPLAG